VGPTARILPDGNRLHLQHGPSDLIVLAEGDTERAYRAATRRFQTIIAEIVDELPALRCKMSPDSGRPDGSVALRMHDAALPFAGDRAVTRMASVAGAIADEILAAMTQAADLTRAYVNNGGDIALHLAPGTSFRTAIKNHDGTELGRIEVRDGDNARGIATSGRHGRSLSMGIADSVTALAGNAAQADMAATLIGNAVDVPGHRAITRRPAREIVDDSDLGDLPVVTGCGRLDARARHQALANGRQLAETYQSRGLIAGAGLFLHGASVATGDLMPQITQEALHA